MRILLATTNAHKLEEVAAFFAGQPLQVEGLDVHPRVPEPPEDGDTFEANALQKARFVYAETGLLSVADDSGLEVEALSGAPGVHSKRYTPEATAASNNRALLRALDGVTDRRARFRCVIAVVGPGGEATLSGACEGLIGHQPQGSQGFGYDPLFWPDEVPGRCMADLSMAEKNRVSHRGRALIGLPALVARLSCPVDKAAPAK